MRPAELVVRVNLSKAPNRLIKKVKNTEKIPKKSVRINNNRLRETTKRNTDNQSDEKLDKKLNDCHINNEFIYSEKNTTDLSLLTNVSPRAPPPENHRTFHHCACSNTYDFIY